MGNYQKLKMEKTRRKHKMENIQERRCRRCTSHLLKSAWCCWCAIWGYRRHFEYRQTPGPSWSYPCCSLPGIPGKCVWLPRLADSGTAGPFSQKLTFQSWHKVRKHLQYSAWKPPIFHIGTVKRRLPVIPRERNGGLYAALGGNLSSGGDTYDTSRHVLHRFHCLDFYSGLENLWRQ